MSDKSFKVILKSTSIFGGVQVFQIVVGLIRSKLIAVLLGPYGMGISGLLTSTTGFIAMLTNFGLSTSAVKDVAAAHSAGDRNELATTVKVFNRLVMGTGLLGMASTIILSSWLSVLTFGNYEYTFIFAIVSVTLLIDQLTSGKAVILRGLRQLKYMAKSSVIGSILGLIITIPLYFFWGIKAIPAALILSSIISLTLAWFFSAKIKIESVQISWKDTLAQGKGMIKLGFMISLSGIITLGMSYFVRIYISNNGGIEQVGLYNAGFAIVNTYVGMIFTAMSTDYYPRLSGVSNDVHKYSSLINQQSEMAIIILAPILIVFLVFANLIVIVLYSASFSPIKDMLSYSALGIFFKAASWPIGFIFLAKGDSKIFFLSELLSNIYVFSFNVLGFHFFGLTGLGIAFFLSYFLLYAQVLILGKRFYAFKTMTAFKKIFAIQLVFAISCFLVTKFTSGMLTYTFGSIFIIVSSVYSIYELNKRIEIKEIINRLFKRKE